MKLKKSQSWSAVKCREISLAIFYEFSMNFYLLGGQKRKKAWEVPGNVWMHASGVVFPDSVSPQSGVIFCFAPAIFFQQMPTQTNSLNRGGWGLRDTLPHSVSVCSQKNPDPRQSNCVRYKVFSECRCFLFWVFIFPLRFFQKIKELSIQPREGGSPLPIEPWAWLLTREVGVPSFKASPTKLCMVYFAQVCCIFSWPPSWHVLILFSSAHGKILSPTATPRAIYFYPPMPKHWAPYSKCDFWCFWCYYLVGSPWSLALECLISSRVRIQSQNIKCNVWFHFFFCLLKDPSGIWYDPKCLCIETRDPQ